MQNLPWWYGQRIRNPADGDGKNLSGLRDRFHPRQRGACDEVIEHYRKEVAANALRLKKSV
jgi:hypothetical protein